MNGEFNRIDNGHADEMREANRMLIERDAAFTKRIRELEAALDSISGIGTSDRLDIACAKLHGVMETAKAALTRKPDAEGAAMMGWCSKHELFEICPECMREMREAREQREWCLRMARLEGDGEITAGIAKRDGDSHGS